MSISKMLAESMGERSVTHEARQLERIVATSSNDDERHKRVVEAYDAGRVSIDTYVAAVGMRRANVRHQTSQEFVAAIQESMSAVSSKTVAAFEAHWKAKV